MSQITLPTNMSVSNLLVKIQGEKNSAVEYQSRRWSEWNDNYTLDRNKVSINLLTQRQSITIPLLKETKKTVLSRIQEEPEVDIEDKGGDADKEIKVKVKWHEDYDRNTITLVDDVEKKQVILYGRTHTKHNWVDGKWVYKIKDIYDIVVDPKTEPLDNQTARHMHELHIYRPLVEVLNNDRYDADARAELLAYKTGNSSESTGGSVRPNVVVEKEDLEARMQRLIATGLTDELIEITGYDDIIELNETLTLIWDNDKKKYVKYVVVWNPSAGIILRAKTLDEELGIDYWPVDTWADDIEAVDYWSDGIADILRPINQTINVWVSQLVENRTLRNFGMNFYDATADENFTPLGLDPRPAGWYPLPGKPSEVYQRVDIPDIGSVIQDIQFMVSLAEKASATGAIDKGVVEAGKRTLGEIEIAVSKAMERTTSMSKYYRLKWKRCTEKWYAILEANQRGKLTLYTKNESGRIVKGEFDRDEWVSEEGYIFTVKSYTEQLTGKVEEVQRLQGVKQFFPENPVLDKVIKRRALNVVPSLRPEELQEIMDYEEKKDEEAMKAKIAGEVDGGMGVVPGQEGGANISELANVLGGGVPQPQQ